VAGARSTLLSLWKVSDYGTTIFMKTFYTNLLKRLSRADALAATQAHLRSLRSGLRDEHYWAAFQLTGDWTPLAKP
jgi:CHAT domain-containing protein